MTLLMIVAPNNRPVFETMIPPHSLGESQLVMAQLVISAALDMVDEAMWNTKDMYLKVVDEFNKQSVTAFVTAGNYRFLLLHDGQVDERNGNIKNFYAEVYEYFVKMRMNPFYDEGDVISSEAFQQRVTFSARKYL